MNYGDLKIPDNTPDHCKHRNWIGIEAYCLHTVKALVTISGPSTVSSDASIVERLKGKEVHTLGKNRRIGGVKINSGDDYFLTFCDGNNS